MSVSARGPSAPIADLDDACGAAGPPYHRTAHALHCSRTRGILGTLLLLALIFAATGLSYVVGDAWFEPAARGSSLDYADPLADNALFLGSVAAIIPLAMFVAWSVDRRPAGTLWSVVGRIRWRWLGGCAVLAMAVQLPLVAYSLVAAEQLGDVRVSRLALSLLVLVVLVPLQATGEEVLFRGWGLQLVGRFLQNPWPGAVVLAAVFALGHGTEPPVLAFTFVFGLMTAVLTIRTGGLEAGVATHAAGNTVSFVLDAFDGGLDAAEINADIGWADAFVAIGMDLVFLALVLAWLAPRYRRRHNGRLG